MRANINNIIDLIISYLIEIRSFDEKKSQNFKKELLEFTSYLENILDNKEKDVLFDKNFVTSKKDYNKINLAIKPEKKDIIFFKKIVQEFSNRKMMKKDIDQIKDKLRLIMLSLIKTKYKSNKIEY